MWLAVCDIVDLYNADLRMQCAMQGDPADSVFFIEDGDCQVGYNQRRTADEDLISTVSNQFLLWCAHVTHVSSPCAHARIRYTRCCCFYISALLLTISAVIQTL